MTVLSRRQFGLGMAGAFAVAPAVIPSSALAQKKIAYYSDYFSFVGWDAAGLVAFAIDNNRGQYGAEFQADHFISYYDETRGFVLQKGDGRYDNASRQAEAIPNSPHWSFEGSAGQGIVLSSASNGLALKVSPLTPAYRNQTGGGSFWVGAAPAILEMAGRTVPGRVIYEYLHFSDQNRFVGIRKGKWNNFNGLYLATGDGADFYLHHSDNTDTELTEKQAGFATWADPGRITDISPGIPATVAADGGSYAWPTAWAGSFTYAGRSYTYELHAGARDVVHDWGTGGFAMAIAQGEIKSADGSERRTAIGYAELLI